MQRDKTRERDLEKLEGTELRRRGERTRSNPTAKAHIPGALRLGSS